MKTSVPHRRSLVINGRKKTLLLEKEFWIELQKIAKSRKITSASLIEQIAKRSGLKNLAATLRIFVFRTIRNSQCPADRRRLMARGKGYRQLATRVKDARLRAAILAIACDYERMAAKK